MNSELINISVLYGTGSPDPGYRELFSSIDNLKLLQEAQDPETFLNQHQGKHPDLVLVDLNGSATIPGWLNSIIAGLPQTEVVVCSHSRDPDFLIRIMKLRAGGFIPLPLNREEFLAVLDRARAELNKRHAPSPNHLLVVTGTKGGVGTTSIATNLAVALAEIMPGEVMLIDLARPFPHVSQFLDLQGIHSLKDLVHSVDNLDPIFVKKIVYRHKSNLDVLPSYPDYQRNSPMLPDVEAMGKIFTSLRTLYNWVVVDLGVWLDLFSARVLQRADRILLVTELTIPDLFDMKIIMDLFRKYELDGSKVKVVVNRYLKNYALGLKDLEDIILQPAFYTLPYEHETLIEAINQGEPMGEVAPRSKLWRRLKQMASELAAQDKAENEAKAAVRHGLLQRMFS